MWGRWVFIGFIFWICSVSNSQAFIINELLADPPTGLNGDANRDGIASSNDDEFAEFFNSGTAALDLSGWTLSDATKTRHIFPAETFLPPQGLLVVFGGGNPQILTSPWQIASTGTLSLNNTGDVISLFDRTNHLIEQVSYGAEAGNDQSIVRSPEGVGETFVRHATLPLSNGAPFSPGYLVNPPGQSAVVPEWPTVSYALMALFGLPILRRFQG